MKNLRGKFGDPLNEDGDDGGKNLFDVEILQLGWGDFFKMVKAERDRHPHGQSLVGRLKVIQAARELFARNATFSQIDLIGRKKIAGLVMEDGVNFLWFGSMRGSGHFQSAINNNNEPLSLALDLIPAAGAITRESYLAYINQFRKAFPNGGVLIATATRLLAMKRPDTFVCLDSRNKAGLCAAFGIKRSLGYEEYWDSIIQRIMADAAWWAAPPPSTGVEREVWEARAAFLDARFYDGKDMPSS